MQSFRFLGLVSLLFIQYSIANSKHLKTGTLTRTETIDGLDGTIAYTTRAKLSAPILVWQDLKNDGISMTFCGENGGNEIHFTNVRHKSDFQPGAVITFERGDYEARKCATPPQNTELDRVDGIIFRKIVSAVFRWDWYRWRRYLRVETEFVSGVNVCPTVETTAIENLDNFSTKITRAYYISADSGSANGFATYRANLNIYGGLRNFRFFRQNMTYSWDQDYSVTTDMSLTLSGALSKTGNWAQFPIPGASFSGRKLFLIGKVSGGLFVTVGYDTSISLSQKTTMTYSMGFSSNQRIYIGKNKFNSENLDAKRTGSKNANIVEHSGSSDSQFAVTGFAGVRVGLLAEIDIPWFKSGAPNVSVAASVGVNAKAEYQHPYFYPVSSGIKLNSICDDCHEVQATVNGEAKSLKIEANIPGRAAPSTKIIASSIASVTIGTVCLFRAYCNGIY